MIKIGVLGSSLEAMNGALLKLLAHHPDVEIKWLYGGEDDAFTRLEDIIPSLKGETSLEYTDNPTFDDVDAVFYALRTDCPLDRVVEEMQDRYKVIVLYNPVFEDVREVPGLLYGVPELNRKHIVHDCNGVYCPNPVAYLATLALLPLAKNLMLNSDITVGIVEGMKFMMYEQAGHVHPNIHFIEPIVNELRNTLQTVQTSFNKDINLLHFVNDSSDSTIATITVNSNTDIEVIKSLYNDYYDDHNFVFLTESNRLNMRDKSSKCLLHLERIGGKLVITASFDNLIKGIVGVAIHNMNLLFGLHERVGLLAF